MQQEQWLHITAQSAICVISNSVINVHLKPIYDKFITDKRTSIALCSTLTAAIGKKRRSMLISIRKIKRDIIENYKAIY